MTVTVVVASSTKFLGLAVKAVDVIGAIEDFVIANANGSHHRITLVLLDAVVAGVVAVFAVRNRRLEAVFVSDFEGQAWVCAVNIAFLTIGLFVDGAILIAGANFARALAVCEGGGKEKGYDCEKQGTVEGEHGSE